MPKLAMSLRRDPTARALRVGVFGLLGLGNIGNDGLLHALLAEVRRRYPDAEVQALCGGPESVKTMFGIDATPLHWNALEYQRAAGARTIALKAASKAVDAARIAAWVRTHDAVIVPGAGVLEATLPIRPWGLPYSLFALCLSGRLLGTKVALVGVGSDIISKRATRWLVTKAASLAYYRSYRDDHSRDAMRRMGVDVSADAVYPDLAFALPTPMAEACPGSVGVGVMTYQGGNDDRHRSAEIFDAYVAAMQGFVRWLVDDGRQVRLFTGDKEDDAVVADILADLAEWRPAAASQVVATQATTLPELLEQMAEVDTVVATRFHNVLCALKVGKPTVSVGYAAKNDVLMAAMGLGEFCQQARAVDLDRLIEQFREVERRRDELTDTIAERNRANADGIARQFADLSAALFPGVPQAVVGEAG